MSRRALSVWMLLGAVFVFACGDETEAEAAVVPEDIRTFSDEVRGLNEEYCDGVYPPGSGHESSVEPCIQDQRLVGSQSGFPSGHRGCYLAITRDVAELRDSFRATADCLAPFVSQLRDCLGSDSSAEDCRSTYAGDASDCTDTSAFEALSAEVDQCGPCEGEENPPLYCTDEFAADYLG